MKSKIMKLSAIKQNPNNPRSINKDKFAKLVKSIEEFPRMLELRPIVLNKDNIVLGGNMRLKACKHIGLTEVPVVYADDLTEEEQRQFIIKDNVGFGDWDWELLANEWDVSDLNDWGLDLPDMDVQVLEAEEDNYEEPDNLQVDVVLGDLIEIGEHRLLCGDSTDSEQVAKLMNGEKADCVYTDPPYGINEKTNRVEDVKTFKKQGIAKKGNYNSIIGDDSIQTALDAYTLADTLSNTVIYWGGNYYAQCLPNSPCWIVWDKRVEEKQRDINSDCELAYVKHPHKKSVRIFRHLWKGMIKESERGQARVHPTQKPVALAEWCLKEFNPNGTNVCDLFLGSGSTMVAAHQLNRKCYGMELDPKYCQVIIDRMVNLDSTLEVKINGKRYDKK